jgi:hypothetical protein
LKVVVVVVVVVVAVVAVVAVVIVVVIVVFVFVIVVFVVKDIQRLAESIPTSVCLIPQICFVPRQYQFIIYQSSYYHFFIFRASVIK